MVVGHRVVVFLLVLEASLCWGSAAGIFNLYDFVHIFQEPATATAWYPATLLPLATLLPQFKCIVHFIFLHVHFIFLHVFHFLCRCLRGGVVIIPRAGVQLWTSGSHWSGRRSTTLAESGVWWCQVQRTIKAALPTRNTGARYMGMHIHSFILTLNYA